MDVFDIPPADHHEEAPDSFAIFGEAGVADVVPASPQLLPRAIVHPHFTVCANLWPPTVDAAEPDASEAHSRFLAYSREHAEPCARGLRKSRSQYGKACARSLLAATEAFHAADLEVDGACESSAALMAHARACRDLCSTAIEESNWDVPSWQEANLLALGYELVAMLREPRKAGTSLGRVEGTDADSGGDDDDGERDVAEALGQRAIALFNLCVAAACPMADGGGAHAPAWLASVGALLRCAEAFVGASDIRHRLRLAPSLDSAWRIPSHPPSHSGTPSLSAARRIQTVAAAEMSGARFFCEHLQCGTPVIIRGHLGAEQWEAIEYFSDLRRMHDDLGGRLLPVNLGSPLVGYAGVQHWPMRRLIEDCLRKRAPRPWLASTRPPRPCVIRMRCSRASEWCT